MLRASILLAILPVLLAACSANEPSPDPITHERFVHAFDQAQNGLSTGDFETAAVTHGRLAVDPAYKHVLNFLITPMLPPQRTAVPTSGPLILFTDTMDVIVFSPTNHFYETLIWMEDGAIHYGVEGEIDALPADFRHEFIMVKGRGLNRTIEAWGALIRGDNPAPDRYADLGISHLGYWTDNGAYYYYKTEDGMNEEETLLAVKEEADTLGINYGYFQLDSWWYFKAPGSGINPWGGVTRWEPQPEMFPDGLTAFQQRLGLPLLVHNRWFAPQNDYEQDYNFVEDGGPRMALPEGGQIFEDLMANAKQWGVFTYEQDWLIPQFWGIPHLRNGVDHTARWMRHIDSAARGQGMTTQITMAGAAHLMDSVNLPSVTTVRTSIDYAPAAPKTGFWPQFHTVNMLASALGIWPFKDNFHSSEAWGEEETLISILSAGMVGVGDRLGASRADVINRTCRSDGMLLKPDKPALPLDAMFLPHERPYLTHTFSDHGLGRWHYVAGYHIERGDEERRSLDDLYAVIAYSGATLEDMFVIPDRISQWNINLDEDLEIRSEMVSYDWQTKEAKLVEKEVALRPTTEAFKHRYMVLAPVLDNDLALIGEPGKYITVADRRFTSMAIVGDALELTLAGAPGEVVELLAFDAKEEVLLDPVRITLDESGTGQATLRR